MRTTDRVEGPDGKTAALSSQEGRTRTALNLRSIQECHNPYKAR
jgi:hypothetical protein